MFNLKQRRAEPVRAHGGSMRLAYLAPAVLGLCLMGCGPDEPEEVDPPPATTEQPQAPTTPPANSGTSGDVDTGPLSGDSQIDEPANDGNSPPTDAMRDPPTGGTSN